jgi:N-acetylgalactosamine PTS system EIIA component
MSDTERARGVVVAHGDFAEGLVQAARQISGAEEAALVAVSNRGMSPAALEEAVRPHVESGPVIVFVDLPSGSCAMAARRLVRDRTDVPIVFGANLPLLLDFLTHRDMPLTELVPRILARGRSGISSAPASLDSNADRAVSYR